MMATTTKERLTAAALRLAAEHGINGASVRRIAKAAGVTEGALYRHFKSKDDLWREIYTQFVSEIIREKEHLIQRNLPARQSIHEWVRLTYDFFDSQPDAFTYVLLMPTSVAAHLGEVYNEQGKLFIRLIRNFQQSGQIRSMDPELALSHFSGILLNVPRLINEGVLPGPATRYVEEVSDAAWRLFRS